MSSILPNTSFHLRVVISRLRKGRWSGLRADSRVLRTGLALGLYIGLLAQGFGAFWGFSASSLSPESESLISQTAIVAPTKQCVHHRVACPPQCFCPPLKSGHEAGQDQEQNAEHHADDHSGHAHASESEDGANETSDLLPGDLAFEACHSAPIEAVTLSGIPAHLRMDGRLPFFLVAIQGFVESDGIDFESADRRFPDKVPIFSAV